MASSRSATGVASPCIGVCRMHEATGWCEGCLRSIDEIVAWGSASEDQRLVVLRQLPARRRQWVQWRREAALAPPALPDPPAEG